MASETQGLNVIGSKATAILSLSRTAKRSIVIALDTLVIVASVWIAYYLRLGAWMDFSPRQWISLIAALGLALPIFAVYGLYRTIFRFVGLPALAAVVRAVAAYGAIYAIIFTFIGLPGVARTVGLIQPLVLLLGILASRIVASSILGDRSHRHRRASVKRVLIYGAGSAGRQLAGAMANSPDMRPVGFVDDDRRLHGGLMAGLPIYNPAKLGPLVDRHRVSDILLAIPSATRRRRNEILKGLRKVSVSVRTLPGLMDLAEGKVQVNALRDLDIEDLLGRDVAMPNQILFGRNILGKTVLVTGAGGSIGSELCRQIVAARPFVLLLVEMSEYALYAIDKELTLAVQALGSDTRIVPLMASVRDDARLAEIMRAWHPNTVYHAAAYKHVPLVEHNPVEGIRNNVFGTMATARAAVAAGVSDFVLISTDKAVRPTNVMGTSKRLAELVLQALAAEKTKTRFSMVRFGNVLGSSGSVVPLFRQQIRAGGPVTITHSDVTRYFMTIPEAAQLVIQAGAMASGGDVFILDMGEPVRIVDLARNMIELSGMSVRDAANPDGEIAIDIVGLRPGEKLYEELLIGDNPAPTAHPLIMKATEKHIPLNTLTAMLARLSAAMDAHDVDAVRSQLVALVPEYTPDGEPVDWIHLERLAG